MYPIIGLVLSLVTQDSGTLTLRQRIWDGLSALERAEQQLTTRRAVRKDSASARILESVRASLDTMVFTTSWGSGELEQLRLAFPGSALLARYAALAEERAGQPEAALMEVDRLLWHDPADAGLQRVRGRLLEKTGRPAEAFDAYSRAFDLSPEDDSTYTALRVLSERRGTLGALLDQIRRLRIRVPSSRLLADHEIEITQRLGVAR